jgi:hypothetical protein
MDASFPNFILGYHGCDRTIAEKVFAGKAILTSSHNDYDWLGDGIYFWEYNAQRAFEYGAEIARHPRHTGQKIKAPTVIGAIINLGSCLNLLDSRFIGMVKQAYEDLARASEAEKMILPVNSGGADLLSRKLDCAVLRALHNAREEAGEKPFDSVRAASPEGEKLYHNAGFDSKTHIQIWVRNPACIKGYFRPLDDTGKPIVF